MRLSLHTDYSLRILMVLARETEGLVSVRALAEGFGISNNHLAKVAQDLVREGWVQSFRGRNGGLSLAVDPATICIGKVIRRSEARSALVECLGPENQCVIAKNCQLKDALRGAEKAFYRHLDKISLADLVDENVDLQPLLVLP